jgi:hypothetical protein
MIIIQAWFDHEVKSQLNATETTINSIEVLDISYSTRSANLTVNTSVSNPHDITITIAESNFSIKYHGTKMGFVHMPRIILESKSDTLIFNTTFVLGAINIWTYGFFGADLVADGEVTVNLTGKLRLSALALFFTVHSSIEVNSEIILTTDLISYTEMN